MAPPGPGGAQRDPVEAWAAGGGLALTGPPDGPGLGPPAPLVARLDGFAGLLRQRSAALGDAVDLDPLVLLTERAALAGLCRRGRTSCGGAARLLRTADGWLALSLARDDDVDLVPAWLGLAGPPDDPWTAVAERVAGRPTAALVDQAAVLGLPVGGLPASPPPAPRPPSSPLGPLPLGATRIGDAVPVPSVRDALVVELGSLWAGPLCGSLLADAGARVVKVESVTRPDGARSGNRAFFDLVNAGKRSVALDLHDDGGRHTLLEVLRRADVVVEGSRPRALEQLGIEAQHLLGAGGPRVWVSITGHGRTGPGRDRVGFGDDAAVSGGLVSWSGDEPYFCADAVADPATGLVAAAAALDALAAGGRWLLDVPLAGVAAHLAGPTLAVPAGVVAGPPRSRPSRGAAPALGQHTDAVLAELGIAR